MMSLEKYKLETGEFQLALDSRGNLCQLISPLTTDEGLFLDSEDGKPNFYWFLSIDEKDPRLENLTFHPPMLTDHTLVFRGHHPQVTIELSVVVDALGPNWSMSMINHGPRKITEVGFALKGPFAFGHNLHITFPYCAGWALPLDEISAEEPFVLNYPVNASMQWTTLYTDNFGIYFGVHDPFPLYKELSLANQFVKWTFLDLDLNPGEHLELPPVYLIPHGNSWRGGAECYQIWAQQHVEVPYTPEWYAQKPTWAWVGLKGQNQETTWHQAAYLPSLSALVAQAGVDLIQLTAYTEHGHDTLYPDYSPGECVGGPIGLRQAVDEIHQSGKRISIYTNGRLIDPSSSISLHDRQEWGVRTSLDADVFTEQYGDVIFDVMCPGAAGWRSLFIERLEHLVRAFDIDGIYIDQISGCRSLPCYASNHDHEKPNMAWSFYLQFIAEIRERLTSIKPDIFLATEGVNDLLGQYFDSQQAHNDWSQLTRNHGIPLSDLFRAVFPGQLLNIGCITQEQSGEYYLKLAHVSGGGCDFGIWNWKEIPSSFIEKVKDVVEWHAKHANILRFGKVIPLYDGVNSHEWEINAFYEPSKIVVNGARLGKNPESQRLISSTFSVPIPFGTVVSSVQVMDKRGTTHWDYSMQNNNLKLQINDGSGEMIGVAIELSKSPVLNRQLQNE